MYPFGLGRIVAVRANDQIGGAEHLAMIRCPLSGVGKRDNAKRLERQQQQPVRIERRPFGRDPIANCQIKVPGSV